MTTPSDIDFNKLVPPDSGMTSWEEYRDYWNGGTGNYWHEDELTIENVVADVQHLIWALEIYRNGGTIDD